MTYKKYIYIRENQLASVGLTQAHPNNSDIQELTL